VINLVLQDSGVPPNRSKCLWLCTTVEALDRRLSRARYKRRESGKAKASFEEFHRGLTGKSNLWIDDHLKRNRSPFLRGEFARREFGPIFWPIFDNRQLDGKPNLGRRQAYTWRISQSLVH
jgi:hypothetical protein